MPIFHYPRTCRKVSPNRNRNKEYPENRFHSPFKFLRMPYSFKKDPSTLQRVMDNILTRIQNERYLVYIVVYSATIQEHITCHTEVFKQLCSRNIKIQSDKWEFLGKEVAHLDHLNTQEIVKPNSTKLVVSSTSRSHKPKRHKIFPGFSWIL